MTNSKASHSQSVCFFFCYLFKALWKKIEWEKHNVKNMLKKIHNVWQNKNNEKKILKAHKMECSTARNRKWGNFKKL